MTPVTPGGGPAKYHSAQGVPHGSAVDPDHSPVSNPQLARVSPALRLEVDRAIDRSWSTWQEFVAATTPEPGSGLPAIPLVLKYIPVERAKDFLPKPGGPAWPPPVPPPHPGSHPPYQSKGIFIGSKDYTWGKAIYVTGIHQPLSTATYGRVGLVSHIDLGRIYRVFDARVKANYKVYLKWLRSQPSYPEAILTFHTNHWLHGLRNAFRLQFEIDVVICSPDEPDLGCWYTQPNDIWLGVSDFVRPHPPAPIRLRDKFSTVFRDVRFTIVVEEEFVNPNEKDLRLPLPRPPAPPPARVRPTSVRGLRPIPPSVNTIADAYWNGTIVRIPS
jgi:hypothetical protein